MSNFLYRLVGKDSLGFSIIIEIREDILCLVLF